MTYSPHRDDREKDKFRETGDGETAVAVHTLDENGNIVSVQHPLPTDGDSVYEKDLNLTISDNYDFTGSVADYFNSLESINTDTTANNPKQIKLWFKRTVYASAIGLGCNDLLSSFSNIKIELLGSGGAVRDTIDLTADNTKLTSKLVQFAPSAFNGVNISFHTADQVCLSNITIRKEVKVVAQIEAIQDDGTVIELTATNSGNLKTTDAENGLAIAKGEVTGSTFVHKFGNAPDFDTSDNTVTVWDGADDGHVDQMNYVYSTTADIDSISSDSAADTFDIQIQGLDANWQLVEQTVTLTGQTRAALTTPLLRVFRMVNTNGVDNVGHIYCYVNGAITNGIPDDSTTVRAVMQPGNNQTLMAIFTVPAGKTGYIRDWYASTAGANKNSNYTIELRIRPANGVFQMKHLTALSDNGTSYLQHTYNEPEIVPAMADIEMRTKVLAVGATQATVSAGFDLVLIDDE